jgi:hypothetical protein
MSSFDYHVHTDLNLIEVHPLGAVQISDIRSYAQEVLSLDIVNEGTIEYYDLSETTNLKGGYESARGLSGLLQEWISRGWQGSVFFTSEEYQFGFIRMMGAIVENIQEEPPVVMIPRREPTALGEVRDLIAECRQDAIQRLL